MEPKRGRWFAVLALHVSWFIWTGLNKGFGVMLPRLQEDLDSSAWVVGESIALISGVSDFVGRCLHLKGTGTGELFSCP